MTEEQTGSQRQQIDEQLGRILASPAFSSSKQSASLLRYVVLHSLEGADELLRERVIGVEVFGREPGYDAREDPVVRTRANEVRKRLARYYQETAAPGEIRLEMPTGSYRVNFEFSPEPVAPAPPPPSRPWWKRAALAAVSASVVLIGAVWLLSQKPPQVLDRFWKPVIAASQPVVICAGHPIVFQLSHELQSRIRGSSPNYFFSHQAEPLPLTGGERIEARDIIPMPDQYIGLGSTYAIAGLTAYFASSKKSYQVRFGNDISFSDLRNAPAVLIGAFQNRWALELSRQHRYVFDDTGGIGAVLDRTTGKRWAVPGLAPNGRTNEDYAIVSRFRSPQTGQLMVLVAGITQYGCRAAGEFVTSPDMMAGAFAGAGSGWEGKNVQVVLHARVLGGTPERPEAVALHVW